MANTYFITGAQGCIGSWVVKALVERGDVPVVFDRSDDSRRLSAIISDDTLQKVRFVVGEITDYQNVLSALKQSGAQRVIHLAGLQVPTCKADPVAGAMVNVVGMLNVFEAVKTIGADGVVYASSAAVYGMNDDDVPLAFKAGDADHQEGLTFGKLLFFLLSSQAVTANPQAKQGKGTTGHQGGSRESTNHENAP